ncbi:MAG: hypothetical protein ABIT08_00235 [Bacteroidia bacterium]
MRKFSFPVGVLIAAARLGWINCKDGIIDFASFRAIYTAMYIQAKQDAIINLKLMPDEFERSVMHESLRTDLSEKAQEALKKWRKLRRYMMNSCPVSKRNERLKEMGRAYLTEFLKENWTAGESLLNDGSKFLVKYKTELEANSNMPAVTFKTEYDTIVAEFIDAKNKFYTSEKDAKILTREVNEAANAIYDDLNMMLQDGLVVYEDNDALKEIFVLQYLLDLVTPTGPAGLKGTAEIDGKPAVGIIVELENKNLSVVVDAEGVFNFGEKLASGKDKLIFKRGDQILLQEEVDIPPGTTVTEHVDLPAGNQV